MTKKKYYTKDLKKPYTKNYDPWLNGTFMIDPQTWEVKHTPKNNA